MGALKGNSERRPTGPELKLLSKGSSSKKGDCESNESWLDSSQAVVKEELLLLKVNHVVVRSQWGLRQVGVQEKGLDY